MTDPDSRPTFLPIAAPVELTSASRAAADSWLAASGSSTLSNLQATLIGHVPSFVAYQQFTILRDELAPYIGERALALFSLAISEAAGDAGGTAHYRGLLIAGGTDVDNPQVTEAEQLLIDWGRLIATAPQQIPDAVYSRLQLAFNPKLRIMLVAYAGQLVATNLVNAIGRIPVDGSPAR